MNLSTKLCDLTAGEYVTMTQGAGVATSLLYIVVGGFLVAGFRFARRWWRARKIQPPSPPELFPDALDPRHTLCDERNFSNGLRCDLVGGHDGDHGAWNSWQRDPAAEPAPDPGYGICSDCWHSRRFHRLDLPEDERYCTAPTCRCKATMPFLPQNTEPGHSPPEPDAHGPACLCGCNRAPIG